jgi:signal transduction histidine kinase
LGTTNEEKIMKEDNLVEDLRKAHEEIRRLKQIISDKDLEVSFVVHDLKNPLSIIEMNFSLISGVLEEHEELSKLTPLSSLVESQIIAMKHLILELLNISKMENSMRELELKKVNLNRFLKLIVEENSPTVQNNGMNLCVSVESGLGFMSIDQNLLERVFANLIVNAVKYSIDSKEVVLHAMNSDKPEYVRFIVEDFGAGIPAEDLRKVFEKFQHSKTKGSTQQISHGLGLYFSKLVVELHGGTIRAESEPNKGSRFIFELPRKPPTA